MTSKIRQPDRLESRGDAQEGPDREAERPVRARVQVTHQPRGAEGHLTSGRCRRGGLSRAAHIQCAVHILGVVRVEAFYRPHTQCAKRVCTLSQNRITHFPS